MNLEKLKRAEAEFFYRYPAGFDNLELIEIRKKHNLNRMFQLAQDAFAQRNFHLPELIIENTIKVITHSSLISVFEKTRFREFVRSLPFEGHYELSQALEIHLHEDEQAGFEALVEILQRGKLAKWSPMTICPAYYHPQRFIFIKPTTTKRIIQYFELDHLHYQPTPTWTFYRDYRATIDEMRSKVDSSLFPYYRAFTGFLMRTIGE